MNRAIAGDQLGEPFDKVLLLRGERGVLEFVTLAIVRSEQLDGTVEGGLEFVPPRTNRHRGDISSVGERCLGNPFVLFSGCLIHTPRRDTRGIVSDRDTGAHCLFRKRRCSLAGPRREVEC